NTAYMSSNKNSAVVKFNTLNQSTSFRIPCALHATQIALVNFENTSFGKIDGPKESYKEHPFNLINLAFKIHDGYNTTDKDNSMNLRSEHIHELYKKLLNYAFNKYQQPISTRWKYQLIAAQQYLSRHDIHIKFCNYYRAHEMPDAVLKWTKDIKNAQENITELFEEELEEANSYLDVEEYQRLCISLESGLKKAYEGFCKWMTPWIHLPLLVCALGGSNGSLFASAFLKVYTNTKLQESQSNIELNYIEILNNDKNEGLFNTWGLLEVLENLEFKK
ncbi:4225_t:CDS:2, partial [Gigaspora rosea]